MDLQIRYIYIESEGRLYDPTSASFVSPAPFVQSPDNTQSFNRYSYCLNNPLMYTDPSGEFFLSLINAVKDLFTNIGNSVNNLINGKPDKWNGTATTNAWKIDVGLFKGSPLQILSRFTGEGHLTLLGYGAAQGYNLFGGVESVNHYGGATVVKSYSNGGGAFTLGSYIIGSNSIEANPHNPLFQHEYGHYLQSQSMGLIYLFDVGIPSLVSAAIDPNNHNFQSFEQDANMRAFLYFNRNVDGFYTSEVDFDAQYYRYINRTSTGGNFYANPLDVDGKGKNMTKYYYDYRNIEHRALLHNLSLKNGWNIYGQWLRKFADNFKYDIWSW